MTKYTPLKQFGLVAVALVAVILSLLTHSYIIWTLSALVYILSLIYLSLLETSWRLTAIAILAWGLSLSLPILLICGIPALMLSYSIRRKLINSLKIQFCSLVRAPLSQALLISTSLLSAYIALALSPADIQQFVQNAIPENFVSNVSDKFLSNVLPDDIQFSTENFSLESLDLSSGYIAAYCQGDPTCEALLADQVDAQVAKLGDAQNVFQQEIQEQMGAQASSYIDTGLAQIEQMLGMSLPLIAGILFFFTVSPLIFLITSLITCLAGIVFGVLSGLKFFTVQTRDVQQEYLS